MPSAEIGLDNKRIGKHLVRGAFCDLAPIVHGNDAVGQRADDAEVVLDHDDRADEIAGGADVGDQLLSLPLVHAGGRLVQEQRFGPRRQRPGNLEPPGLAIGEASREMIGFFRQMHPVQEIEGGTPKTITPARRKQRPQRSKSPAVVGANDVFQQRHTPEQADVLERSRDAEPADPVQRQARDLLALEANRA